MARGFSVAMGDDPESEAAARVLGAQMLVTAQEQVGQWLTEVAPGLPTEWARVVGIANTSVALTPAELEELSARIDELIAPYAHRPEASAPAGARIVRMLRHYLPAGSPLPDPGGVS